VFASLCAAVSRSTCLAPCRPRSRVSHVTVWLCVGCLRAFVCSQGGCKTALLGNGMTRAPLLKMTSLAETQRLQEWLASPEHFAKVASAFNATSRFGRLEAVTCSTAGRSVYLRFRCLTGDAMGMNMITKGVEAALVVVQVR
jgi:hydroxymethylglutaryl-CoA reductase (NADPH)